MKEGEEVRGEGEGEGEGWKALRVQFVDEPFIRSIYIKGDVEVRGI